MNIRCDALCRCLRYLLLLTLLPCHANAADNPDSMGWYAWSGMDWVQQPRNLNRMSAGDRLLLSFTAQEWAQVTQNPQRLQRLHLAARGRGITLELLLGEPNWVLPEGRSHLTRLLRQIPAGIFSMAHLDLERNQLPPSQQAAWPENTLQTLREAVAASPVPVALITHYRELQLDFVHALAQAGIREVTPMIYVANAQRTIEITRQLPRMPKGLRLSIAQSMERALPREESSFNLGQKQALKHWREIRRQLRDIPEFRGIMVQSWEDYREAAP
ncbi:MAG: hypothetical protein LBQ81_02700 [Zoogloeaceae bacterium]|jgi:hypothetical protein|nr:hypothetical protein [Zoogloeaceae bacterium]